VTLESYDEVGYNYRMTDLQAVIGLEQLRRMDIMLHRRRQLAARYTTALKKSGWLLPPAELPGLNPNFQSYMARMAPNAPLQRDELMQALLDQGISTRRGVMATHYEQPYRDDSWSKRLPETERVAAETVILPLFHQMTDEEQDYVIGCLQAVAEGRRELRPAGD
jgi:dTDP-4-amino-4,6-dideoxygalactose transaminase